MLKKLTTALLLVLIATGAVAQTGLTCDDPIPVGTNYEGKIDGPCTIWYTANTYDLPLRVFFVPDSMGSTKSPEVLIDFTCNPGVYDDPKLDSLINKASVFGVAVPIQFRCGVVDMHGKNVYELSINNSYRDDLSNAGLTYNVPAFVQVNFFESGTITLTPDTIFTSCIEHSQHVKLGDTLDIVPNDSTRAFALPYTNWKNDSIRYVWIGEGDVRVWLAKDNCEFTPSESSIYVDGYYDINKEQPYKLQPQEIKDAIKDSQNGGMFFAKVLSSTAGKLVVERIPETPPAGGAILMEYDKPVVVQANSNQLYAYPKTWTTATMFQPSLPGEFSMQISNSYRFVDSTGVFVTTFSPSTFDVYAVHITSTNMKTFANNALDKYLYVRFTTDKNITITPHYWDASPCLDNSRPIIANNTFSISTSGSSTYYRIKYADYAGYDLTVNWEGNSRVSMYIGDTCQFVNSASNAHVIHNKTINKKTAYVIPATTVDSWSDRVDDSGFLYVRFSSTSGKITFQTEKPEPVIPTDPCVINSIEIKAGDQITLNLDSAFTVYSIKYADWLANGASLTWSGAEVLHTFVAETCEFFVAPYNKYVHAYIGVPATGNVLLDPAALENLAEYVDENGYLYIRFLTEKEGVLTVK